MSAMEPAGEALSQPLSTPNKSTRSFSDPQSKNGLAPSPSFLERERTTQDDDALLVTPRQARRPDFLSRGLTLQLPSSSSSSSLSRTPPPPFGLPLSPKLDPRDIYMQTQCLPLSPATNLPRHSRGLDFSRACSTLHHSTLAEQSSPDSSPVITQKGVNIPGRRMSMSSMALDSPFITASTSVPWGSLAHERSIVSSSVGSINMLASESEMSDSDEDASMGGDDNEDPMFTTPQVHKLQNPSAPTPFVAPSTPGGTSTWGTGINFSPAQTSLMRTLRRNRLPKGTRKSRKSSSSASNSGYSSMASPRAGSPPPLRSIESAVTGGYFTMSNAARSRRESMALGTDGLHLSSGNDSGDEAAMTAPSTPGVVRRPVTRRGNLLPKTKGFARIRAALAEEAAPLDTDVRKEAETIRQVRERDTSITELDLPFERPQTATAASSPQLLPAVPESSQEDFGLEGEVPNNRGLGMNFAEHANRNGGGLNFWNRHTPPPPSFNRQSSSAMSDVYLESPMGDPTRWRRPRARSSASDASEAMPSMGHGIDMPAGVSDDVHLQKFKKRQREDDYDIATIKRRAVSPGMSAQNSPILTNSPSQRDLNGSWGMPPERKDRKDPVSASSDISLPGSQSQLYAHSQPSRSGSVGSAMSVTSMGTIGGGNLVSQGKKLGLQPMVDTNDGLMKMSIE